MFTLSFRNWYLLNRVMGRWILCKMVISSLVADAYAKCGEMSDATRLFDGMNVKDVLAWTTMVLGYAQCGTWWWLGNCSI